MDSFTAAERDVLRQVLGEFLDEYGSGTFWNAEGRRRFGLAQSALDKLTGCEPLDIADAA